MRAEAADDFGDDGGKRRFWIAAAILAAWAVALALWEVWVGIPHRASSRGFALVAAWALGVGVVTGLCFARGAGPHRSFLALAGAVVGTGTIGIVAGMLAASSGYARWRESAEAHVAALDTGPARDRGRAVLEDEASYGSFMIAMVAPRAQWPFFALVPIAIVVAVVGARAATQVESEP